ncbi:MAG: carboxypeptidase regulatory-like domain-containing protein [Candidatus Poribacteria bacterium]|nr:carboxypeptidase regulatory-like domain-containing protein [Candidatus Poribacteria bacterium]
MIRFSFMLAIIACVGMSISPIFAQEEAASGGTVRGKITDTSNAQNPIEGVQVKIIAPDGTEFTAATEATGEYKRTSIPPGRYLINIHKKGYGDRRGKPVTVVNGGDHYVPLKMTKKADSTSFTQRLQELQKLMASENMTQNPQEHWYSITLMNIKIGYMHSSTEKVEYQGETVDRNKVDIVMNFKALGTAVTVEITRVEYTGPDAMPRHFLSTSNESRLKQVEGSIVDGVAHLKTTLNGETTESEIPVPSDTISEHVGVTSLLRQKELKIGDKRTFHIFSFDLLKPVKTEIEILEKETLTYQSEEKQVYVLRQTMDMMNGITAKLWIDTDGVNYRTEVPLMGLSMVTMKTDKETAVGETEEVDIVLKTRILPSGKRPTPRAERLEAEVKLSTGNIAEVFRSNPQQKLEVSNVHAGKLSIEVPSIIAEDCPNLPIQNIEGEFLAASAYIQADHPDIQAKAEEILEGEVNSWRAAEKLCRWVYASISDKKMSGGFGSSLTTLESLSGDCTEHTVLFIALARAAGIPARICSGIVFAKDAFYYHFWPEVYVGRWIQMDPTLDQVVADANHIQLGGSLMESDNLMEFADDVFHTLNQLEIAIVE